MSGAAHEWVSRSTLARSRVSYRREPRTLELPLLMLPGSVSPDDLAQGSTLNIQLITFMGCPNAEAAREALRRCLCLAGCAPAFEDIDSASPLTPAHLRDWGSPTVLIDGVDVGGEAEPSGGGCRLYRAESGRTQGWPFEAQLLEAIRVARRAG
jgi:hypothetical protein